MRTRNALIGLLMAIVLVGGSWAAIARKNHTNTPAATPTPTASATPDINVTKSASFTGVEGEIALVTLKKQFTVETKEFSGLGEYVNAINGLTADAGHYWSFYVNGASADVGASAYTAKAGDQLEFRYVDM